MGRTLKKRVCPAWANKRGLRRKKGDRDLFASMEETTPTKGNLTILGKRGGDRRCYREKMADCEKEEKVCRRKGEKRVFAEKCPTTKRSNVGGAGLRRRGAGK